MKRYFTSAVFFTATLVLCLAANAYYPVLIVRECPHCKGHVVEEATLSGNTIGAVYYTDGKREAKMLPNHPLLAKCPACNGLFWVDEAAEISSGFEAAEGKFKVLNPSEGELLAFLSSQALPKDKEMYLRQKTWWAANDAWRYARGARKNFTEAQVRNMQAFSNLLDEKDDIERIFKAEIARELGRFDECRQLLSTPVAENLRKIADFIRGLAEEGDRDVWPIAF